MDIVLEGRELRDSALSREWVLTDGTGGYASSTVAGANTRKYHGLLVVPRQPPVRKEVHLALLEEEVVVGGRTWPLSTFLYQGGHNQRPETLGGVSGGAVHPRGFEHLERFAFDGLSAVWEYRFGDLRARKRLRRLPNAIEIEYATSKPAELVLRPLVAARSVHSCRRGVTASDPPGGPSAPPPLGPRPSRSEAKRGWVGGIAPSYRPASLPPSLDDGLLHLRLNPCAEARPGGPWYWNFLYPRERERGYDAVEDLRNSGTLRGPAGPTGAVFRAWLGTRFPGEGSRTERPPGAHPLLQWLWRASASFLARRDGGWTVVAGHPWFDDWGRDTFVSLPGLTLTTRRFDIARSILETWTSRAEGGLIPNLFTDDGADHRSADATLWLFAALDEYVRATRDRRLLARLFPKLKESVEAHLSGTPAGVWADVDGLLRCPPGLTWMDARVGGEPVTPRGGKPVEIEALWHNALRAMESFARALGKDPAPYSEMAARAVTSFREKFLNSHSCPLLDAAEPDDFRLRPNGLLAVSLPHPVLEGPRAEAYLRAVEERLLTPFGPRTLDPADSHYRGRYLGSPEERDRAYHQGTVWPWLLGPYVSAVLRVRGPGALPHLRARFEAFVPHLREAGLGTVSEVFDGDPPHAPGGCPAQAWSVAELLRSGWTVLPGRRGLTGRSSV